MLDVNRIWGIALDPSGSKLYTANGASNDVSVVDMKSRKELHPIKVGEGPWGIAIVSQRETASGRSTTIDGREAILPRFYPPA
jgi:YVTN family beta-propeller protein